MKIPVEILAEKNYEGTRLIEINDEAVNALNVELKANQKDALPLVQEMEAITPKLDPFYKKIGEKRAIIKPIEDEIAAIKEEMEPTLNEFKAVEARLMPFEQKAQLIKNKMQPIILDLVTPQLSEFEKANQMLERDGKIYVEVIDEIEEKVKSVRAVKAKK
jgi:chromosome segregation ATPase